MTPQAEHTRYKSTKRVKIVTPDHKSGAKSFAGGNREKNRFKSSHSAYGISKSTDSRSRSNAKNSVFTVKFEEQMTQYITSLSGQSDHSINETEQNLEKDLEDLVEQLHIKCSVLQDADATLRQGLKAEVLKAGDSDDSGDFEYSDNSKKSKGKLLVSIIAEFSIFAEKSSETLQDLWNQWDGVQQELLCLAVEIYGQDIVTTEKASVSTSFQKQIDKAVEQHDIVADQYRSAVEELENAKQKVVKLVDGNIDTIDAQLEDIKIGQRKKKAALKKAYDDYLKFDSAEMVG